MLSLVRAACGSEWTVVVRLESLDVAFPVRARQHLLDLSDKPSRKVGMVRCTVIVLSVPTRN